MSKNTEKSPKPSVGDYPVDPEERSNQEARLRKAAAAGANASKSPISALKLQLPSSVSATQINSEPQRTMPKTAEAPKTSVEDSDFRIASSLTNDEILAELRKISAWADSQRKATKWSITFLAVFILAVVGAFYFMARHLDTGVVLTSPASHPSDWYDVDRGVRQGDFEKAIAIGEELIQKTPQSPEAHERLARAYLAAGNLDKSKEHFAEAFRLFPSEENEKLLNAIEKRIKADKP